MLPEYFHVDESVKNYVDLIEKSDHTQEWLLKLNQSYKGIIIGGTMIRKAKQNGRENLYISTPVLHGGEIVDWYNKRNLSKQEEKIAKPGSEVGIFSLAGQRFAVLSGEDSSKSQYFQEIAEQNIRLVFTVCNSVHLKSREKEEKHFAAMSAQYNLYITRCCSSGNLFKEKLYGRSLTSSPKGIIWRTSPQEEKANLIKTLMIGITGEASATAPVATDLSTF